MSHKLLARLTALAVLCSFVSLAAAQQEVLPAAPQSVPAADAELIDPPSQLDAVPVPPQSVPAADAELIDPPTELDSVQAPAPSEAAESPAVEATPVPEAPAAAANGAKRILVLPIEFTVYEKSVAGMEAVKDWTDAAQKNLGEAAVAHLGADSRFQTQAFPSIEGEAVLREHIELFKIVANTMTGVLQWGGKAFADKRASPDYSIGDGLAFLADATGADYAFIMAGGQVKQTGGSAFMQFVAAAGGVYVPGGGTYAMAGIIDLRSGEVKWLNSAAGEQMFGMTGTDTRTPAAAQEVVDRMFKDFPSSRFAQFPAF